MKDNKWMETSKLDKIISETIRKLASEKMESSQIINEMARISPRKSGLSMLVWLNPNDGTNTGQHNCPRLKFQDNTNPKLNPSELVPMSIDAENPIILVDGYKTNLPSKYINNLRIWIVKNYQVLMDYWNDKIYEDELMERLQSL